MAERLRVVRRALTYPADAESLAILRRAGGLSRVPPAERANVRWKRVQPGEWCDDLPAESLAHRLATGDVVRVTVPDAEPPRPKRKAVTHE